MHIDAGSFSVLTHSTPGLDINIVTADGHGARGAAFCLFADEDRICLIAEEANVTSKPHAARERKREKGN